MGIYANMQPIILYALIVSLLGAGDKWIVREGQHSQVAFYTLTI
jgi:hypothetical protein